MASDLAGWKRLLSAGLQMSSRHQAPPDPIPSKPQGSKETFPKVYAQLRVCSFLAISFTLQPLKTLLQGRGVLQLFFPTTAVLSRNDICPGKELFSPCLNVYVPNTCSSDFVHQFLKQECLVLN